MGDDTLDIRLNIDGHVFALGIEREKEEIYRRAEKELNALVSKYRGLYRTHEDNYLPMAALELSVMNIEKEFHDPLAEKLGPLVEVDLLLDDYLLKSDLSVPKRK